MGWIDSLAASIVGDAEEAFVQELTGRFASMLEDGVTNPDRLSLLSQVARQDALSVWARHKAEVTSATTSAFREALSQQDEALCSSLAAAYGTSKNRTNAGNNAIDEAARGMASIISRDNVALADGLTDRWYQVTADAVTRTQLGDSYRSVMEDAVSRLSKAGLTTIDYRSGVKTPVDAAVRRHVVSQASQCRADLLMRRCDEWGCDLVSVDAHWGARPSHAAWQGKVYSRSGRSTRYPSLVQATGYGTVTGLAGVNCKHVMTPYVEGYSKMPDNDFSDQERLTGMTSDEWYEATQRQRAMERKVRSLKRSVSTGQDRGLDMTADRYRLGRAQANLMAHCEQYGLRRDYERERAYAVSQQPRGLMNVPTSGLRMTEREANRYVMSTWQSKVVLSQKQRQHIPGTDEWDKRVGRLGDDDPMPSSLSISIDDVQGLVDRLHGTGVIHVSFGGGVSQIKETVRSDTGIIGMWTSDSGEGSETDMFTIHYSKRGVHIVPSRPSAGR
jgi:hypothetical protein